MSLITRTIVFWMVIGVASSLSRCRSVSTYEPSAGQVPEARERLRPALLPFGDPTNSGTADKNNFLIEHDASVISYNEGRGTMNWTAWKTEPADLGDSIERPFFEPDPLLDGRFRRIDYRDYSGSGYDRGHMVPSADRFGNAALNRQTFYLSNIVPQEPDLNQYPWQDLEIYARNLVRNGSTLYTIAGVYGEKERIRGRLTAPTNCWKVIVVFKKGSNWTDLDQASRVIAVDMPNVDGIGRGGWKRFLVSVREIERRAGVDIFSALPQTVQDRVENSVFR